MVVQGALSAESDAAPVPAPVPPEESLVLQPEEEDVSRTEAGFEGRTSFVSATEDAKDEEPLQVTEGGRSSHDDEAVEEPAVLLPVAEAEIQGPSTTFLPPKQDAHGDSILFSAPRPTITSAARQGGAFSPPQELRDDETAENQTPEKDAKAFTETFGQGQELRGKLVSDSTQGFLRSRDSSGDPGVEKSSEHAPALQALRMWSEPDQS